MTKVQTKASDIKAELDHTLIMETSVDVDEIAKLKRQFPKSTIIQSIFKLENRLGDRLRDGDSQNLYH